MQANLRGGIRVCIKHWQLFTKGPEPPLLSLPRKPGERCGIAKEATAAACV